MKARYGGETLGEVEIMEVIFEDIEEDVPVELARFIRNHVLDASMIKGTFNDWKLKVIKGNNGAIRRLYRVQDIGRGYSLEMARRERNRLLKSKSKIPRSQDPKISQSEDVKKRAE